MQALMRLRRHGLTIAVFVPAFAAIGVAKATSPLQLPPYRTMPKTRSSPTATAANAAIVTSLVVNFGIELFGVTLPYGINGGFIALLLSMTLFFGIALASAPPRLDPDIAAVMDL